MDIFRIKNNNRIIKLTENSFQKETDRKYPYVQTINGEKKYYAICPHCGNPVIIVNLYRDNIKDSVKKTIKLHARHVKSTIKDIAEYNESSYLDCPLSNPESFGSSIKRAPGSNMNNDIFNLIKNHPDLLYGMCRSIIGINFSEKFFIKMMEDFAAAKGYEFRYINKYNLPYSFLYMVDNKAITFQKIFNNEIGKEIENAIKDKCKIIYVDKNKQINYKTDENARFTSLELYFSNYKRHDNNDELYESIELLIKENIDNNKTIIFEKTIIIDNFYFTNIIEQFLRLKKEINKMF